MDMAIVTSAPGYQQPVSEGSAVFIIEILGFRGGGERPEDTARSHGKGLVTRMQRRINSSPPDSQENQQIIREMFSAFRDQVHSSFMFSR